MVELPEEKGTATNGILVGIVIGLSALMVVGLLAYYSGANIASSQLRADYDQLQTNYDQLQANYDQLQANYNNLQTNHATLQSNYNSLQSQVANLQSQIESLQSQLLSATALIAQLQGPTGILPTYMDLGYTDSPYPESYCLQLSLKNTGTTPITQIFVTLDSAQVGMTFTYLNVTVSAEMPLPPYETTTGRADATPPIYHVGTYPLLIQALTDNGTIYTYQTTVTSHV